MYLTINTILIIVMMIGILIASIGGYLISDHPVNSRVGRLQTRYPKLFKSPK